MDSPEASLAWLGEEGFSAFTIFTGSETVWLLPAAICGKWFSCGKIVTTLKKLQFNAKIIYIYFSLYFVQYKFHFCLSKYHCEYFSNFNFFYLNLISTYYCPTRKKKKLCFELQICISNFRWTKSIELYNALIQRLMNC